MTQSLRAEMCGGGGDGVLERQAGSRQKMMERLVALLGVLRGFFVLSFGS